MAATRQPVVWLVEDNDLYRTTIESLINLQDDLACPVARDSCEGALEELESALDSGFVPDIVLMDIELPGIDGVEGARQFVERSPATRVIMLTVHDDRESVFRAIVAGASGYLLKSSSADDVVEALRQVDRGASPINAFIARRVLDLFADHVAPQADYGLTPREREILELMVEGLTMQRIADRLFVSYHTVDTHVSNIYAKLHVHSRGSAVAKALKERLI